MRRTWLIISDLILYSVPTVPNINFRKTDLKNPFKKRGCCHINCQSFFLTTLRTSMLCLATKIGFLLIAFNFDLTVNFQTGCVNRLNVVGC